jgi:hypothetical protein
LILIPRAPQGPHFKIAPDLDRFPFSFTLHFGLLSDLSLRLCVFHLPLSWFESMRVLGDAL